jgi:hypothetical protein
VSSSCFSKTFFFFLAKCVSHPKSSFRGLSCQSYPAKLSNVEGWAYFPGWLQEVPTNMACQLEMPASIATKIVHTQSRHLGALEWQTLSARAHSKLNAKFSNTS